MNQHYIEWNKFPKVAALFPAIQESIFTPGVKYDVTEKLDGANTLVERTDFGFILCSKNNIVAAYDYENPSNNHITNDFNGFVTFMFQRAEAISVLPVGTQMFGEWLVPHTLKYPDEMWGKFYAYDWRLAEATEMDTVEYVGFIPPNVPVEDVVDVASNMLENYQEKIGRKIEGLVLAAEGVEPRGHRYKIFAKDFKEQHKKAWNPTKVENVELAAAGHYPVRAYQKVCEKIRDDKGGLLGLQDTPQVIGRCTHDYFQEYFWQALKALHWPIIDSNKVKKNVEGRVREIWLTEMNTGKLPTWAEHELHMARLRGK